MARRALGLVATLLVAAAIIFVVLDLLPGDPARFILGIGATDESVATLHRELGLDQPGILRFFGWLGGMLIGNFGMSVTQNTAVGGLIAGALGVTIPLTLLAIILATAIGVPAGLLAARRSGSVSDRLLSGLARILVAVPGFWMGMLLVLLFAVALRWLPPGGFVPWGDSAAGALGSLILPALALALPQAAALAIATRAALVDAQDSDYVRAARARGLTLADAVRRHGMRNALLAVLATIGVQFATLIAGTVIVENVFYLPGLGRLIFDGMAARDLLVVRSALIVLLVLMSVTMFLARLGAAWADPRLRAKAAQ